MDYSPDILAKKLKAGRKYRGFTQAYVAKNVGLHTTSYGKLEYDTRRCGTRRLALIANLERLDIRFYFLEEMSAQDADLNMRDLEAPIESLSQRLDAIENQILPPERPTNPAHDVANENIKKLVEMIQNEEDATLQRIIDMIHGFLIGKH